MHSAGASGRSKRFHSRARPAVSTTHTTSYNCCVHSSPAAAQVLKASFSADRTYELSPEVSSGARLGWYGLSTCSSLGLLLTRDAEVVGVGELSSSPSPHPPLQPVSVSIIPSSAMPGMRVSFLREQSSPKPPIWATRLLMGWGFPQASSPSTLTLTSLRANDTLSALTAKGRHSPGPSCSPPTPGLLAAHCCPQHTIAQATW